jgi:hypothetical protein
LVRALAVRAVVEPDPIEEQDGLLAGQAADEDRCLSMGRLLHERAGLVSEGVGRRARQRLLDLPSRDETRGPASGFALGLGSRPHHGLARGQRLVAAALRPSRRSRAQDRQRREHETELHAVLP